MSKLLERKDFGPHGFRWLTLKRVLYQDPSGRKRVWESAERTTRAASGCDAVAIIAKVRSKSEPLKIILEAQYRPSQDAVVVEVPAGLIDQEEDASQAAARELKEETGYTGQVTAVSELCFSDPGMTNSNMQWAVVDVDADAAENANVKPELEPGEFIDVFLVPFKGLHKTLLELQKERGWQLDARLLAYAWGLQHSQDWDVGG
ncbi:hypothetical protein ABBQ32_004289 [Trebouxia sp. C0010 RCD-2024]